ncbi:MAG TPA: hypothetical protein PKC03_03285 [Dokdonella sp.]|nr:hypothetical protein [Dokdonella sp.]
MSLSPRSGIIVFLAALMLAPTPVSAQWSANPASNLVLADGAADQVQAKIVARPDGGFYVSWFDSSSGYGVYLQRLDAGGNEQWAHGGILVAARDFSSTQDYGLDIDSAGNALLAFRYNDGSAIAQIVAQKVAPDGSLLWTAPGVFVSADAGGANSPKVAGAGNGSLAVAWSSSAGAVVVQKLDASGAALWTPAGVSVVPASGFFFLADVHGDSAGNVIVSWSAQLSFQDRELWAQKFASADGGALWGATPVKLFNGSGGAMQLGNFPPFIEDGAGGGVFVWYTVGVNAGTVRIQHVDAAGASRFAQNGLEASADTTRSHVEPSGAYDPVSGDIYALWRETDIATQGQIGVYAQRVDSSGARQWGSDGKVLVALSSVDQSQMRALPVGGGGLLAAWSSNMAPNPMPVRVARLASDGSYAWPAQIVDISTEANATSRLAAARSSNGFAAYAWTATGSGTPADIHAQDINLDGSLGNPVDPIFADGFDPD